MRWNVGVEADSFVRIRRGPPTIGPDGRAQEPVIEDILEFPATRDPAPDELLAILPEGERQAGVMFLFTETELRSNDDNEQVSADYVLINGELWEVREVSYFPRVIPHYEVRVMRIKIHPGSELAAELGHLLSG